MTRIKLSHGLETVVDDIDADLDHLYRWRASTNPKKNKRVAYAVTRGTVVRWMHRMVYERMAPNSHPDTVDHIDRDALNNRRNNLRAATKAEQTRNASKSRGCKFKYKGVGFYSGSWVLQIKAEGLQLRMDGFKTEEEAVKYYDNLALLLFGEFASPNVHTTVDLDTRIGIQQRLDTMANRAKRSLDKLKILRGKI